MRIIDTHLHIWNKEEFSLPWLDGEGEVLNRTYSLEDYKNALEPDKGYEVEAAVYVEVDCARRDKEKENLFIAGCCANPGQMFAGACISGYLNEEGFKGYIDKYASEYVKGVRQVLHVPEALPGTCLGQLFVENVRYLGKKGLVFEGCVRNAELGDLYETAKACPDTTIVLNHMGIVDPDIISVQTPSEEEQQYKERWILNIRKLASLSNVVCKISGLNPKGEWSAETLKPAVDIALDYFGEDRVMFASNYPVCNIATGLSPWIEALMKITEERGSEFQNKLFRENAKRIYGL